jgi:UDP:flavonoid glycosyltransferase YjiC (YdhE family)
MKVIGPRGGAGVSGFIESFDTSSHFITIEATEMAVSHAASFGIAKTLIRKVVLATVGSLGDLHPFIAVGAALRERGVHAVIACAGEYRSKVEAAGLAFHSLRPGFDEIQRDLRLDREQLTRGVIEHSDFLFRRLVLPYLRISYEDMMEVTADADLVLPSSLAFGARLAAEKRGIAWMAVVLQPMMFLSSYDPPVIPKAEWLSALLRKLGPVPTRCAMFALKKAVNVLFRPLHALRADLGLAPTARDPLFDGQFSEAGAIGLYSRLLGDAQPDYPQPTSIVGFATFDSEDGFAVGIDPELDAFLRAGTPPLVFTLGSLIVNSPGSFYREGLSAAQALGRRAVLLVGEEAFADFVHFGSEEVFVCAYASHSLLFPRAAAIVHHGGIGTLAQALRSGRPQLIVPHFADQLDNAARAARLQVARIASPQRFSSASAQRSLGCLLGDGRYLARAREVGDSLAAEDGAAQAARIVLDMLEQLGRKC